MSSKSVALQDIIDYLGNDIIQVIGDFREITIRHLKPVDAVDADTLDWIGAAKKNKRQIAEQSKARAILCDPTVNYSSTLDGKVLLHVNNPRMAISLVAEHFFMTRPQAGIHPSAVIDPDAEIAATSYIGGNASIGKCRIGENTVIHSNVVIYDGATIGDNVLIHAGTVIGSDGLGCERLNDGTLIKFPHLGGVIIKDNVEIGANCQIAKGSLSNTIIGKGCKINGLTFIAHNCILSENVWITGDTMLAGSVRVEKNVTIFSKVIIREQVQIGQGAIIGMGSVITKSVPPNETWVGVPARRIQP